ncbi:MAG TPA: cbb3-type cytochrome c oxidase N-terminal domain-containing protein [Kofleriaceae bacterium]|jgi:cytochrome c oxidase cbb3-type subunit 3|nr:cbb3-type cytochrome c oxidase N-terminal domain-containing protein [Kofleriaceae bacterium]
MSAATEPTAAPHVPDEAATAEDDTPLVEHSYDGIREYDNPLPGWWAAVFWFTIVFAAGYWVYYHVADRGSSKEADYRSALADYESKRELRDAKDAANISEEALARGARDPKVLERGAAVFASRCASCHADKGQGLIGPNLTDLYQLHGDTRMDVYKTVSRGVPGTAMLAWSEQLPAPDVAAVAMFVSTLRGQQVAGKEAQGAPVPPFEP